ncbi:hypothetical protein PV328_001878 [Microctonus aethiopoides]|uniref:Uncharacterized protein n=1 Tax=Microctonus aethiopoides TaxID=144406 RepID=A0AA39FXX8_9HYME|nr:hypothetical protein PV328_001878 [Microctonus aethiopoides]
MAAGAAKGSIVTQERDILATAISQDCNGGDGIGGGGSIRKTMKRFKKMAIYESLGNKVKLASRSVDLGRK